MKRFRSKREKPGSDNPGNLGSDESAGMGLRRLALTTPASAWSFSPDADFPLIFGVVTDWNVGEHVASILAMRDGSASLYTTSTFGIIGGRAHEEVRRLAIDCVRLGEKYSDTSEAVEDFPLPGAEEVFYYLLGYAGVRRCSGDAQAVRNHSDPTTPLFIALQELLTALRLTTEGRLSDQAGT